MVSGSMTNVQGWPLGDDTNPTAQLKKGWACNLNQNQGRKLWCSFGDVADGLNLGSRSVIELRLDSETGLRLRLDWTVTESQNPRLDCD